MEGYRVQVYVRFSIFYNLFFRPQWRSRVKDHPQFSNGHKTRFWCSQDEAHRSKSSRAARKAQGDLYKPRQSSSGESLAKNRFPCRSRLLISSRDSDMPGRPVVTVRMHHHVAHEPYVDLNFPPEVAQNVYDSYRAMKLSTGARLTPNGGDETMNPLRPVHVVQQIDERALSEVDLPQETLNNLHPEFPEDVSSDARDHETQPPSSQSTTPPSPPLPMQNSNVYHRRMLAHIRNLRDFCDGLEFQLQFNDYRMLEVLEREGARFLDFVGDCLKKEGRLVSTDQDVVPHTPSHPSHTDQPALASLPFEINSGINPVALTR